MRVRTHDAEIAASGPVVTVMVVEPGGDLVHYRNAGHSIDGPIPDTTRAISLSKDVRTAESLTLFGELPRALSRSNRRPLTPWLRARFLEGSKGLVSIAPSPGRCRNSSMRTP